MPMSDLETITLLGVIASFVIAVIALRTLQLKTREGRKNVIVEIIQSFLLPAQSDLIMDRCDTREFVFPNSLNLTYGISIDGKSFKRFAKRKRFLAWKIARYNKLCKKIDHKIGSMRAWAELNHLITSLVYADGVHFELSQEYRNHPTEQLNGVFMEFGYPFIDTINKIKKSQQKLKIKNEKLQKKLDKLVNKWKEKYNIV